MAKNVEIVAPIYHFRGVNLPLFQRFNIFCCCYFKIPEPNALEDQYSIFEIIAFFLFSGSIEVKLTLCIRLLLDFHRWKYDTVIFILGSLHIFCKTLWIQSGLYNVNTSIHKLYNNFFFFEVTTRLGHRWIFDPWYYKTYFSQYISIGSGCSN